MEYDNEVLEQINQEADLLSYMSMTFDFKEKGNNYFTNCPFHVDKTPSLSFNPKTNLYHCFSCGRSGGMIGYLIDFEGLSFNDAVEKAAKIAKIDTSKMCQSQTYLFLKKYIKLKSNQTQTIEHEILSEDILDKYKKDEIKEWVNEGISSEVMNIFDIRIDNYGNRIVYPVRDIEGNLINIKGRTRYENYKKLGIEKYINYYKIGTVDYFQGLNITLPYIREKNEVIIFESVKSVMKAYGWGFKNSVSAEKHSLTSEQIDLLIKLRTDIVFAYDSDVSYFKGKTREDINRLKRVTNVFIIDDKENLLGGVETKNAPADCGEDIWRELYFNKSKVV